MSSLWGNTYSNFAYLPEMEVPLDKNLAQQNTLCRHIAQRELFYSSLETICVIIRLNNRYCYPYC